MSLSTTVRAAPSPRSLHDAILAEFDKTGGSLLVKSFFIDEMYCICIPNLGLHPSLMYKILNSQIDNLLCVDALLLQDVYAVAQSQRRWNSESAGVHP